MHVFVYMFCVYHSVNWNTNWNDETAFVSFAFWIMHFSQSKQAKMPNKTTQKYFRIYTLVVVAFNCNTWHHKIGKLFPNLNNWIDVILAEKTEKKRRIIRRKANGTKCKRTANTCVCSLCESIVRNNNVKALTRIYFSVQATTRGQNDKRIFTQWTYGNLL